jgi:hypothetical protein
MTDLIGANGGSRVGGENVIAPTGQAQAFSAQIKENQEAKERDGGEVPADTPELMAQGDKKKSPIKKILRKTQRQQAKHYVLMNLLQQTDLDAAYQALARELGASGSLKNGRKL